ASADRRASVHAQVFSEAGAGLEPASPEVEERWKLLLAWRGEVLRALETARQQRLVGSSLEARVTLLATQAEAAQLPALFIVSQVQVSVTAPALGADASRQVMVAQAEGKKCERCWNYSTAVGTLAGFATLCERCAPVVAGMGLAVAQ